MTFILKSDSVIQKNPLKYGAICEKMEVAGDGAKHR